MDRDTLSPPHSPVTIQSPAWIGLTMFRMRVKQRILMATTTVDSLSYRRDLMWTANAITADDNMHCKGNDAKRGSHTKRPFTLSHRPHTAVSEYMIFLDNIEYAGAFRAWICLPKSPKASKRATIIIIKLFLIIIIVFIGIDRAGEQHDRLHNTILILTSDLSTAFSFMHFSWRTGRDRNGNNINRKLTQKEMQDNYSASVAASAWSCYGQKTIFSESIVVVVTKLISPCETKKKNEMRSATCSEYRANERLPWRMFVSQTR